MLEAPRKRRLKLACQPCRERKRKCDGEEPCNTCRRDEYNCYYSARTKKSRIDDGPSERETIHKQTNHSRTPSPRRGSQQLRSLEANSGAVFARSLGLHKHLEMRHLRLVAWNLGERPASSARGPGPQPLTVLLSQTQMEHFTDIFYQEFHPVYGLMERHYVDSAIESAWRTHDFEASMKSVLCGVAVLGCVLSNGPAQLEDSLCKLTITALEPSIMYPFPSVNDVIGWVLRSIYLRITGSPHAQWMATCTMMHVLEAAGLHFDTTNDSLLAHSGGTQDTQLRRRVYMVCRLFNNWSCFDYGRNRVELRGATCQIPDSDPNFVSSELIEHYLIGEKLVPGVNATIRELELELEKAFALHPSHPMLMLIMCNTLLCVYRRLRAMGATLTPDNIQRFLQYVDHIVGAVTTLLEARLPWWHVSNMTFQLICALLAINTSSSIAKLPSVVRTFEKVRNAYPTEEMREAWTAIQELLRLHRKQKEQDIMELDGLIETGIPASSPTNGVDANAGTGGFGLDHGEWERFLNMDMMFDQM